MIGQSILDFIMTDRYDPVYGQTYGALNVCNAPELEERCKSKSAPKVVYSIKASSKTNNDMCLSLRAAFMNGYLNLLKDEDSAVEIVQSIRGYSKLSDIQKSKLLLPYTQTSFLINELINLDHDMTNGLIKVKEKSGMRKDRYSSCEYGYYVVQELSKKLKPKQSTRELQRYLKIRPPKQSGFFTY